MGRRYEVFNRRKRLLTRVADLLLAPLSLFQSTGGQGEAKRLLLLRTAYLGDIVMALPAIRALRERFQGASITIVTSRAGEALLGPEGLADEILVYEPPWFYGGGRAGRYLQVMRKLRRDRFDLAIDLRGDLREILFLLWPSRAARRVSYGFAGGGPLLTEEVPFPKRRHKIDLMLDIARFVGAEDAPPRFGLVGRPAGRERALSLLRRASVGSRYTLVHGGSRVPLKRFERMAEAAAGLRAVACGATDLVGIAVPGDPEFPSLPENEISVDTLIELIRGADLLVCHDSAPWHIAQAVGTPACGIFGPSKPWATGLYPGRPGCEVAEPIDCRDSCDETRCHRKDDERGCLKRLRPERVAKAGDVLFGSDGRTVKEASLG